MKYTEILEELKKRGASKILPFTPFADWDEDFSDNGFVVLPDSLPVDYLDPIYKSIDTKPIGGSWFEYQVHQVPSSARGRVAGAGCGDRAG